VEYAGFWIRCAAFLIDIAVLAVLERLLRLTGQNPWPVFALDTAYFFLLFVFLRGRTLGKLVFGLKVIKADGSDLEPWRALLRALFYALDELLVGIGFLLAAVDEERRALHDVVLGTRVVRRSLRADVNGRRGSP
jgi:uncharacterized RDD family membrane protein YckC